MRWGGPHPPEPPLPNLGEGESPRCPLGVTGVKGTCRRSLILHFALEGRRLPATQRGLDRLSSPQRQIFAPLLRHDLHTDRQPFR